MKITSLFLKNKTHFSLTNTHIFLLFLCKIPLFYTVSLSLITVYNYHPQRSWGKVIFSQASVILLTGGGVHVWGGMFGRGGHVWLGGHVW